MRYLYVDNYRGFSKTLIPIEDVNFLVGENSTGKTSILGLFNILSSIGLWISGEFNMREAGMGTFDDIVSVGAEDRSYFSIGQVFSYKEHKKSQDKKIISEKGNRGYEERKSIAANIFTFKNDGGMPKLFFYSYYQNKMEMMVRYTDEVTQYKFQKNHDDFSSEFSESDVMKWFTLRSEDTVFDTHSLNVEEISTEKIKGRIPIGMLLGYLTRAEEGKGGGVLQSLQAGSDHGSFQAPPFHRSVAWIAPIRTEPRKTYDDYNLEYSPEGAHTPYVIRKGLSSDKDDAKSVKKTLRNIGKESGLFKNIRIKKYGKENTAPFRLEIILDKHPLSVKSVGYGVSQALPVMVELLTRERGCWFAVQQPEVHIHPKAQAFLGNMFFVLADMNDEKFLIETHSDYIIDRFRIQKRKSKEANVPSQILFFERDQSGNKVTPIEIDENGDLSDSQPNSYREFFIKEEMEVLGL